MAKRQGAFKSEKRKKELQRQKKQEEKRQKRFRKDAGGEGEPEAGVEEQAPHEGEGKESTEK